VASLQSAAESLNADCVLLRERIVTADEAAGQQQQPTSNDHSDEKVAKKTGQYLVRQRADEKVGFETVLCYARLFLKDKLVYTIFQSNLLQVGLGRVCCIIINT
jgi:hypothetical protein